MGASVEGLQVMSKCRDKTYRWLAARYVRRQTKQLAEQLEGVPSAADIECVHRARVASRRLRAALRMFRTCFPAKRIKKWDKQIRRLAGELGDARDRDVQIELLCELLCEMTEKACSPGIARLLAQLEHDREAVQVDVLRAIERLRRSKVLDDLLTAAKRMLSGTKEKDPETFGPGAREQAGQYILRHVSELLSYQDSLADPEDQKRHHGMRIAAKRLRYTAEIAKPVYRGRLDPIIDAIKRLQTLLGDIHDCDVWVEHLDAFADQERLRVASHFGNAIRFARLEPGIGFLRRNRIERRRQVFAELVRYWDELKVAGLWDALVRVVSTCGDEPRPEAVAPVVSGAQPAAAGTSPDGGSDHSAPKAPAYRGNGSRRPVRTGPEPAQASP
jgi:CHAD domain-containing protein